MTTHLTQHLDPKSFRDNNYEILTEGQSNAQSDQLLEPLISFEIKEESKLDFDDDSSDDYISENESIKSESNCRQTYSSSKKRRKCAQNSGKSVKFIELLTEIFASN